MRIRLITRSLTQVILMGLCLLLTLSGCDKRTYSTVVYSDDASSDAQAGSDVGIDGEQSSDQGGDLGQGLEPGLIDDPTLSQGNFDPVTGELLVPAEGSLDAAGNPILPGGLPELSPDGELGVIPSVQPPLAQGEFGGSGSVYQPFGDEAAATYTIDGRRSYALAAAGAPIIQSPRDVMQEIDEYYLNDGNQVAFTGRFSQASEDLFGVWMGDVSNPEQIFQTGAPMPGMEIDHTYVKTLKLGLGDDGSLAQLVEVQGLDTRTQAYMSSRGAQHAVLMRSGTSLPGLNGPVAINSIEVVDHDVDTHAVVSIEKIVTKTPIEPAPGVVVPEGEEVEIEYDEEVTAQYTLWYLQGASTRPVAHSWIGSAQSTPQLGNGCRIYAPDNNDDNLRLAITGSKSLVFQAQVGGDGGCDKGRAVLRYEGGGIREIVKNGDAVPGSSTHVFNDVSLADVTADGSVVVFANLLTSEQFAARIAAQTPAETVDEPPVETPAETPVETVDDTELTTADAAIEDGTETPVDAAIDETADSSADTTEPDTTATPATPVTTLDAMPDVDESDVEDGLWSFWIMPAQGAARLIALEGEEVQIGLSVSILSGEPRSLSLDVNSRNQVVLKVLLEDAEQPVFLTGTGHSGQPHASIEVPGASALTYAFTENSVLPTQSVGAVLGALGTPYLDNTGSFIVYGEVEPSDAAIAEQNELLENAVPGSATTVAPLFRPYNSIWHVDSQGVLRELIRSGDEVVVAGENKPIASLSVAGKIARPGTEGVRLNNAGAMLLRANIEQKFGSPVLLFLAP